MLSTIKLYIAGGKALSAPVNTAAPSVSGTATVGQTLSISTGTWTGNPISFTYTYQWQRNGTNIGGATSSTYTLVSADAGATIRCVVTATNTTGNTSTNSNTTASIAATVPGQPTGISASTISANSVTVSFTAPADNGGSAITSYTAVSSPGGITGTINQAGSGAITVNGLSTGVQYTFTVYATNAVGSGTASTSSGQTTTWSVPGMPTIGTATTTGTNSVSVSFTPPASNGGTAITSYTAVSSPGNITGSSSSSPITVNGLQSGTSYSFTVYATNSVGNSSASTSSNSTVTTSQLYQANFSASNELYVGSHPGIAANQDFTVECWAIRNTLNTHNFWSIGTETTGRIQLQSALMEVFGGAFSKSYTAQGTGAWHHYAVVRSGGTITVYVDGNSVGSGTYTVALGNTGPVYIGTRSNGSVNRLNGSMSNFRIVIGTAVYTGNFSPPRTNLTAIANTTLLTLQNSTFVDNSGSNRGITNTNNVTLSTLSGY